MRLLAAIIVLNCFTGITCPWNMVHAGVAAATVVSYQPGNRIENCERMSPDERKWFFRFLEGNIFFCGWNEISESLLTRITDREERARQRDALQRLGFKIGAEWAKDNAVRKIDSSLLKEWGDKLKKAASNIPRRIPEVIADIDSQVNYILYR